MEEGAVLTEVLDYTEQLLQIIEYLKLCFYALVVLIVLNILKGV